jgi:hypothetical protein
MNVWLPALLAPLLWLQHPAAGARTTPVPAPAPVSAAAAADADAFAARVWQRADTAALPFAVVDKRRALMVVYRADGREAGRSAVLLGAMRGDRSIPGVGERTQSGQLRPEDLTTPAGRFVAQPGQNRGGEAVIWVDFDAAFAVHRLRPGAGHDDRARRLAGSDPERRRVSAGCVVVPGAFFDTVVRPLLGRGPAIVYVLPESGPEALASRH